MSEEDSKVFKKSKKSKVDKKHKKEKKKKKDRKDGDVDMTENGEDITSSTSSRIEANELNEEQEMEEREEDLTNDELNLNKKKRKHSDVDDKNTNEGKEARKLRKQEKKANKEKWMAKVPKVDKDGIAYTKLQIRRMMKRVKVGLPPVPTQHEEQERRRQWKLEELEEEREYSGMMDIVAEEDDSNEIVEIDDDEKVVTASANNDEKPEELNDEINNISEEVPNDESTTIKPRNITKKRRSKPVPPDYVCMACHNKHQPIHWIYDCPDKVNKPGTNKIAKKLRGINETASTKVFVSGLSFDAKPKDVKAYFETEMKCGIIVNCKLFQFEDSKRSKGQGLLTFDSEESAKKALKLNGTIVDIMDKTDNNGKGKKKSATKKKKELRLGVSKALNRATTKKKTMATP